MKRVGTMFVRVMTCEECGYNVCKGVDLGNGWIGCL